MGLDALVAAAARPPRRHQEDSSHHRESPDLSRRVHGDPSQETTDGPPSSTNRRHRSTTTSTGVQLRGFAEYPFEFVEFDYPARTGAPSTSTAFFGIRKTPSTPSVRQVWKFVFTKHSHDRNRDRQASSLRFLPSTTTMRLVHLPPFSEPLRTASTLTPDA